MASLILGAAGAVVGFYAGGPLGAQIGWAIGSGIGARLSQEDVQQQGPRLNDLKVPGVEYGNTIPYFKGRYRTAGQIWWASAKREIATTTSEETGGKGGGPSVETTTYTYEIDLLIGLADHEIAGVPRGWQNGKLIYNVLSVESQAELLGVDVDATFTARAEANISASQQTAYWRRITVYTGTSTQLPDPTYEAAVGAANAVGYRHRAYLFIEGLQLGPAPAQLPNMEWEVCTKAASASVDSSVLLQCEFDDDSISDGSSFSMSSALVDNASVSSGVLQLPFDGSTGTLTYTGGDINNHSTDNFTVEFYLNETVGTPGSPDHRLYITSGTGGDDRLFVVKNTLALKYLHVYHRNSTTIEYASTTITPGVWTHVAWTFTYATSTGRLYLDGVKVLETTSGVSTLPTGSGSVVFGAAGNGNGGSSQIDDIRMSVGLVYTGDSFTPPARGSLPSPLGAEFITPQNETVADFFTETWADAGGDASLLDVSDISSMSRELRGIGITQVSPMRSAWEIMATGYFLEFVVSDKLYVRQRAGSSIATIPYEDLGASMGGDVEPIALKLRSDIEIPAQYALTYPNLRSDYNVDTQFSDRLVTAVEESVSTIQLPLVLVPSEAKRVVDAIMADQAVSSLETEIHLLGEYTRLEPTDVVTAEDEDGSSYRLRLVQKEDTFPLIKFKAVVDDATIVESEEVVSDDYTPEVDVDEPADTVMELLDIPIGRDADDDTGHFVAAKGSTTPWPGARIMKSSDDISYARLVDITDSAVIGSATTMLGDWDGPRVFDEFNSVTVDIGDGTLTSSTRDAVLANKLTNTMLVGDEIIQFVTATLVSTGVYTLTRLLRGCRGTEWSMGTHAIGDRVVLLRNTGGIRRVDMANAELGMTRYYAEVTFGRTLSSALTGSPASGESFINTGIGKKPFAPVELRIFRDSSNNITGTFHRRTRLSCRFAGSLGINVPLGEDSEAYKIRVYPTGSPNGLLRTIEVTDETFSYTAAQQTTDGVTPGDLYSWSVVQVSETVGDGYALERTE